MTQKPNKELVSNLREIARLNELLGEDIRGKAYTKAANSIEKLDYKISTNVLPDEKDHKISGVGPGITRKIAEFVKTGRIEEIEHLRGNKAVQAHELFSKINGVGVATIDKWMTLGIYTLGDLRRAIANGVIVLNQAQKIGLRNYSALNKRHPRSFGTVVLGDMIGIMRKVRADVIAEVVGSYRRGQVDIGDIDIIITFADNSDSILLQLRDIIEHDPRCGGIFMWGPSRAGFVWCTGPHAISHECAQVDLLFTKYESYYAALNYFTGSRDHNDYVRGVAKKKGYRLNQYGLFKINGSKMTLIPIDSERAIYDTLGLDYVEPPHR